MADRYTGFNPDAEPPLDYTRLNYYELLGVPEDASTTQIKNAFREKMKYAHTDKGGDLGYSQHLGEAYTALKDKDKREAYDNKQGTKARYKRPDPKPPHSKNRPPPPPASEPSNEPPVSHENEADKASESEEVLKPSTSERAAASRNAIKERANANREIWKNRKPL